MLPTDDRPYFYYTNEELIEAARTIHPASTWDLRMLLDEMTDRFEATLTANARGATRE